MGVVCIFGNVNTGLIRITSELSTALIQFSRCLRIYNYEKISLVVVRRLVVCTMGHLNTFHLLATHQ